jgi:uncharacterized protein (TIGR02099 family)
LATLVGARLILQRRADGRLVLSGLDSAVTDGGAEVSPAIFFSEGRLRLNDSEVVWENQRLGLPPLHLRKLNAELLNVDGRHQISLQTELDGDKSSRITLLGDFFGAAALPDEWRGQMYFKAEGLMLERLLDAASQRPMHLAGQTDIELWSTWQHGRAVSSEGLARLRQLTLGQLGAPWLRQFSAGFRWQALASGWSLQLFDAVLDVAGEPRPATNAAVVVRAPADQPLTVRAQLGDWRLEDLAQLAQAWPLPAAGRDYLIGLAPRGLLHELRLALSASPGAAPRWQAAGRLQGLQVQAFAAIPGIDGLDLTFNTQADQGQAQLTSTALTLDFPELFRAPLYFNRLDGALTWRLDEHKVMHLGASEIALDSPDLKTRSRLLLRMADDGDPFIDLQTDFRDGNGLHTSRYLPAGILSDELIGWLDEAIVSGHVPAGTFLLRGQISDFPFLHEEGRFEVLFGVEQAILDYQQGWPRLEEVQAEVRFLNEGLEIELQQAQLLASLVTRAQARVKDLDHSDLLTLSGRIEGPFADALRVLRETPLAADTAHYVEGMQARGRSVLDIDLQIPLEDGHEYRVDGRLNWNRAGLYLADWGVDLDQLNGQLQITDSGLQGEVIRARLWGEPVRLRVATQKGDASAAATHIDVDLQLTPQQWRERFPHWLWDQLEGRTRARLALAIGHSQSAAKPLPITYRFASDLRGLALAMPEPLGKLREEVRRLQITGALPLTTRQEVRVGYGNLAGAFRFATTQSGGLSLAAAEVVCGNGKPADSSQPGWALSGRLARLDIDAWRAWLQAHQAPHVAVADEGVLSPTQRVDLRIGELSFAGLRLQDVGVAMVRTPHAWDAELKSATLEGRIRLPDDPRATPLSARFSRLQLAADVFEQWAPSGGAATETWPDPQKHAGFYLTIDDLRLGQFDLGRLHIKALPTPAGLTLEQMELDGPLLQAKGQGEWIGGQGVQHTRLQLEASSPDAGDMVRALGYDSAIDDAAVNFTANLQWDAPPANFSPAAVSGDLTFKFSAGRVLEVDPGVGRLFGLMSLSALRRRLSLDFSDLFKEGYAFDRIEGAFRLDSGQATTEQVTISGLAADLTVSGRAGLIARDYEQLVTVTPEFSSALPVAGALVGGPVVAAALLLAEQIMGNEVNKLIRYQYRISGSWEDPLITPIETQDGWSLSSLLRSNAPAQADEAATPPARASAADVFEH